MNPKSSSAFAVALALALALGGSGCGAEERARLEAALAESERTSATLESRLGELERRLTDAEALAADRERGGLEARARIDELSAALAAADESLDAQAAVRAEAERRAEAADAGAESQRLAAERAEGERLRLEHELEALRLEFARKEELRIEREREWLDFTRTLSELELARTGDDGEGFEPDPELAAQAEQAESAEARPPADDARDTEAARLRRRSDELGLALRSLFAIDGLRGMDLLETGTLGDGWTGPVVFRLVDADGRLSGSLFAERLRLEGSRSARSVTLVLEDGHETWRGERTPFDRPHADPRAPSVRRVVLPSVRPEPWLEAAPELFAGSGLGEERDLDDGLWNPHVVRGALNELLRRDAAGGYFRLKHLGGVRADVLRDVHLEGYDRDGKLERRLFADRLRVVPQEHGVMIQLEDGAQLRGDDKAAFLDGRYRIYLPQADPAEWGARGIPGVADPAPAGPRDKAAARG